MAACACAATRWDVRPALQQEQAALQPPAASGRTKRAFTLVELLVVIGIIALLISILLPALNRARESGMRIQCLSNIRQLGTAFMMYVNENKGKFPPHTASRSGARYHDWIYWQKLPSPGRNLSESLVAKYLGNPVSEAVLRCPSATPTENPLNGNNASTVGNFQYSYTANTLMMGSNYGPAFKSVSIAQVRRPSEKILVGEEDEVTIDDGHWVATGSPATNKLAIRHDRLRKTPDDATNWTANLDRRGNVAFVDGHADYRPRSAVHATAALDPAAP